MSVGKGIGPKETREMGANKRKEEVGKRGEKWRNGG